jgi:hypothetical protein
VRSGDLDPDSARAHTSARDEPGSASPAVARGVTIDPSTMTRNMIAFVVRFYPRGVTDPKRRREVVLQILELANGKAVKYKRQLVCAGSVVRLDLKCREVLLEASTVRDPNAAIALLFVKLQDTSDIVDDPTTVTPHERAVEELEGRRSIAHAEAWLVDRPDIDAAIAEEIGAKPEKPDPKDPFTRLDVMTWEFSRANAVLAAWRHAGSPETAHV